MDLSCHSPVATLHSVSLPEGNVRPDRPPAAVSTAPNGAAGRLASVRHARQATAVRGDLTLRMLLGNRLRLQQDVCFGVLPVRAAQSRRARVTRRLWPVTACDQTAATSSCV